MRKAWEERMKQWREARERGRDRDDDRDRRDWGRQERDERDDRGNDMRKALEERMKQWRETRERSERDSRRGPQSRGGPQWGRSGFRGPGVGRGPQGQDRRGPRGR